MHSFQREIARRWFRSTQVKRYNNQFKAWAFGGNFDGKDYKTNMFKYSNHEHLNGYKLLITKLMVERTDLLEMTTDFESAKFVMELYKGFKTKASLGVKHEMLKTLATFYPSDEITKLRSEAYNPGLEFRQEMISKLNRMENELGDLSNLELLDELSLQTVRNRIEDIDNFKEYFESAS